MTSPSISLPTILVYSSLTLCLLLTFHSFLLLSHGSHSSHESHPSTQTSIVWACSWLTCVSTALGAVPLFISHLFTDSFSSLSPICNAAAAGMMTAACITLLLSAEDTAGGGGGGVAGVGNGHMWLGVGAGGLVMYIMELVLERINKFEDAEASKMKKMVLVFVAMTLHSFAEGIAIGVAFHAPAGSHLIVSSDLGLNGYKFEGFSTGIRPMEQVPIATPTKLLQVPVAEPEEEVSILGEFITASLAVHNIPEGLAISLALLPNANSNMKVASSPRTLSDCDISGLDSTLPSARILSKSTVTLMCILSSTPQPLMAVPAFLAVKTFECLLPLGLGFAAGAMFYVAAVELFPEAKEHLGTRNAAIISAISGIFMILLQSCLA